MVERVKYQRKSTGYGNTTKSRAENKNKKINKNYHETTHSTLDAIISAENIPARAEGEQKTAARTNQHVEEEDMGKKTAAEKKQKKTETSQKARTKGERYRTQGGDSKMGSRLCYEADPGTSPYLLPSFFPTAVNNGVNC